MFIKKLLILCIMWLSGYCNLVLAKDLAAEISLLSYNIRVEHDPHAWVQRREAAFNELLAMDYDIIAIQEASELMLADYVDNLSEYEMYLGGRSDGRSWKQSWYEFMPIFYKTDKFKLEKSGYFWVSETPHKPGTTLKNTKKNARVFTWVSLREITTNKSLLVGNVHIHGKRADDAIRVILNELKKENIENQIVLAGDFNITPDAKLFMNLNKELNNAGLIDARQVSPLLIGPEQTVIGKGEMVPSSKNKFKYGKNARRIDYIFLDDRFEVIEYANRKRAFKPNLFVSDHFPISVTFRMTANE